MKKQLKMKKEILEGFVKKAAEEYINVLVDATWENFDEEYSNIIENYGDLWIVDFYSLSVGGGTEEAIWEKIVDELDKEGYNIELYDWCKENDINLDNMIWNSLNQIVEEDCELAWFDGYYKSLGVLYQAAA